MKRSLQYFALGLWSFFFLSQTLRTFGAPHDDEPGKKPEHFAMLNMLPEAEVTATAQISGNWSDPAVWDALPVEGAKVLIPPGVVVTVDGDIAARLAWVKVYGTLQFAPDADTCLRVATIVVHNDGTLHVGASADAGERIQADKMAKIIFADFGEIDRETDPFGLSRGLISHGVARIYGAFTTPYAFVTQLATKGSTSLEVEGVPTNWKIGGRLVLPSVVFIYANGGDGLMLDDDEELTITDLTVSETNDKTTVTFNRPLKYDHVLPAGTPSAVKVPLAYLDRNVVFISENPALTRRGHAMFMHKADVQIADALFEQLGRTDASRLVTDPLVDSENHLLPETTGNDRGRYSLHMHRTIPDPTKPVLIQRVSVVHSPKLGVVNHDSNVLCEDSVVYDAAGSAFFTEVGSEIGAFRRNLAIRTVRGGGVRGEVERFASDGVGDGLLPEGPDFGSNGNGFWFQGAGIEVTDNMAFKTKDMAFVYDTLGLVASGVETRFLRSNLDPLDDPQYDPDNTGATIQVTQVPIRKFSGNVAVAAFTGFMLRKNNPVGKASVMENSYAVNISNFGIDAEYGGPKTFRNLIILGGTSAPDGAPKWLRGLGEWGFISNNNSNNLTIENCEFRNFIRGMRFTVIETNRISDTVLDTVRNLTVENGPNTSATTTIERVTFAHTVPLQERAPFDRYDDIELYRPYAPIAPVLFTAGEPNQQPDPELPAPQPTDLAWGVTGSSVFYSVSLPPRAPTLHSASLWLDDGAPEPVNLNMPLTIASPGQGGSGTASNYILSLTFDEVLSAASVSIVGGTAVAAGEPVITGNNLTIAITGLNASESVTLVTSVTSGDGASTDPINFLLTAATVNVSASTPEASELGPTPGTFTILRNGPIDGPLTVHYGLGGNAVNGSDYAALTGRAEFAAGEASVQVAIMPLSDTLAEGSENAKLTLVPDAAYILSGTVSATVTIADLPLHAWRVATFGPDANDPLIAGDNANPDFDLHNNLLEFALASDPTSATTDPLPSVTFAPGEIILTYRRRVEVGDLIYQVQESVDRLQSWQPASPTEEILFDDAVTRVIKASVPIDGATSKLIRLLVSRP